MKKIPVVILENTAFFKMGQVIENYENDDDGIIVEGKFLPSKGFIVLNEDLSASDEKRVREMIRQQFKSFFYNLYTKQSIIIN